MKKKKDEVKTRNHFAGGHKADVICEPGSKHSLSARETSSLLFPTTANIDVACDMSGEQYTCIAEWKPSF